MQFAVVWTLVRPVVSCTLVGATTPALAREHAGSADIVPTPRELADIETAPAEPTAVGG